MADESLLTREVARWIAQQAQQELPGNVEHHVRRMILDHLGGVVASSVGEVSQTVGRHVSRSYGRGNATAIGHGSVTALGAALLNGTNGHGIETDDGYTPGSFHPTSVVLPAVFAVAEERGLGAQDILKASAIGMEIGCRIAAAGHPATRRNHFHNTPVAGVFGATAAAAILMGLNEEQIANALGIAGSHVSGLFEFLGQSAEIKRFHPGKAARDGIASAELALEGLTGPTSILEGKEGYFATYAGTEGADWLAGKVVNELGAQWVVLRTYIKPYPCCRHLHGPIDAALALREKHGFTAPEIAKVQVGSFAIAVGHAACDVSTMMAAQLSIPYTISVALAHGEVSLRDFTEKARQSPQLHDLMQKVVVELDAQADADYPNNGRPAEVTVTLSDGRKLKHRVQFPYGEPDAPISNADLELKVRLLTEDIIGTVATDALIDACWNFQDLGFLKSLDEQVRGHLVAI